MKITIRKAAAIRATILFIVLLLGLKPSGLVAAFPRLDSLFDIGRMIGLAIVGGLYILNKRVPSKVALLIYSLFAFFFIVAVIGNKFTTDLLLNCIDMFLVIGIIDVYGNRWESTNRGIFAFFEIILYVNLATMLMGGINHKAGSYLAGGKNELLIYAIPAVLAALIRIDITGRKLRSYALIGTCIASIVMASSATAVVSAMVFLLVYVLLKSGRKITAKKMFGIGIIVDVILTTAITSLQQTKAFLWFVSNVLNKSISLSGRDSIWQSTTKLIMRHPIIGNGYGTTVPYEKLGNILSASHAHNQYLHMLLTGGLCALLIFLAINMIAIRKIDRVELKKTNVHYAFIASLSAVYTAYLTEAYTKIWWIYIVYILAYYYSKKVKKTEK